MEPGDGLPALHLRIHRRILTDGAGHARWKYTRCNAIDHPVNTPYIQNIPDKSNSLGTSAEVYKFAISQVMATSPRSDILMNLPALEKLETMLLVSLH